MKQIQRFYLAALAVLTVLWWLADTTDWAALSGIFAWRVVLMQYSGMIGMGVMSLAMILAVRPVVFEGYFNGLDKMYRLHKWLGISALVVSIGHWLLANAPKWAVGWGWLERPVRPPRPVLEAGSLEAFFAAQRKLAEGIGEWAFYAALLLMVLALIKRFPYRRFFQTHKLLAIAYLALVCHAVMLLKFETWATLFGVLFGALMAAGAVSAVLVLFKRRIGGVRVSGRIAALERFDTLGILAVDIVLAGEWPGHAAGQFAFATFHDDEGPHPFTLTSAWRGDGRIQFVIKQLGDYTRVLPERLRVGDEVTVEGPFGRFDFVGEARRQIWIGGGIGITPFIARMKDLAAKPDGKVVDLFHTTVDHDAGVIARLNEDALSANVKLHVLWDERDGRLDAERLCLAVPDWRSADVWFCGPAGFGRALKRALVAMGFPAQRFHQELFEMR